MEIDPPCLESFDQVCLTSGDDLRSPTVVRSYECTFCKRGFSNAQALGGHMNIHRKDKAKLKQPSPIHKKLNLDVTKKNLSYPSMSSHENKSEFLEYYTGDKSCTIRWPWIIHPDEDFIARGAKYMGELRQLDLFAESPSSNEDREFISHGDGSLWEEKTVQCSNHVSARTDVDLELRLGREPLDRETTGTIEFF